jgi:Xaa-Pro aminopeptidase/Xaa-Pro dipeptidase
MPLLLMHPPPPPPPTPDDLARWQAADVSARPARLARLRERLAAEGVDAYFGVGRENSRYLAGFVLAEGEEKVSGDSGRFFVSADEVVVLADTRYLDQAREECVPARIEECYGELAERWPALLRSLRPVGPGGRPGRRRRLRRVAVEATHLSHALWTALAAAEPAVELVAAGGWVEELRSIKEPAEVERIGAACGVADAALDRLVREVRAGMTERELALRLEWEMRTNGAEAVAFDVTCLSGPRSALPHGAPGERRVAKGEALLFDFGAQVAGYRSDMTRTFFVGEPSGPHLRLYLLIQAAQEDTFQALSRASSTREIPTGPELDDVARRVVTRAGFGDRFGHGLGHGVGLATHERPFLGRRAAPVTLPTPSVFSVEPGVYLPGDVGVRIEDLIHLDVDRGVSERLTQFTRELTVLGG